ncbi:hypothetical protein Tco_0852422 [Tanacetum coccineum]
MILTCGSIIRSKNGGNRLDSGLWFFKALLLVALFSPTHSLDYTLASPDYSLASSGTTSPDPSDDLSMYFLASLAISPFHDKPYMKVMQAYNATSNESPILLPQAPIASPTTLTPSLVNKPVSYILPIQILHGSALSIMIEEINSWSLRHGLYARHEERDRILFLNSLSELSLDHVEEMEDIVEVLVDGRVIIQQDFDKLKTKLQEARSQIAGLQRNMAPKRTSTSATPTMTQTAIRILVADSIAATLEEVANIA